ncbi:MAG: NYN domain-containing protein [Candidatus Hermodarchaeota archaeon]
MSSYRPSATHSETSPRIALFIDFDNIAIGLRETFNTKFDIQVVISALSEIGRVIIRRAYGDWHHYAAYRRELVEHGVELTERPVMGADKNGGDIKLSIDALELALIHHDLEIFAIVSGDSDFLPLLQKLHHYNRRVIIISAEAFTSRLIIKNCDEFIRYERLASLETVGKDIDDGFDLLIRSANLLEEKGEEVYNPSRLKEQMKILDPAFSEKDYGFSQFKKFLLHAEEQKVIKLQFQDSGQLMSVQSLKETPVEEEEEYKPSAEDFSTYLKKIGCHPRAEYRDLVLEELYRTFDEFKNLPPAERNMKQMKQVLYDRLKVKDAPNVSKTLIEDVSRVVILSGSWRHRNGKSIFNFLAPASQIPDLDKLKKNCDQLLIKAILQSPKFNIRDEDLGEIALAIWGKPEKKQIEELIEEMIKNEILERKNGSIKAKSEELEGL